MFIGNAGQFMGDLIISPCGMQQAEPVTFGENDLVASAVPGLQWLVNSPKQRKPLPFRVPDPRAFALHKAWLSQQPARR